MSKFTENRDRRCREIVAEIPKEDLYPASKTKGMRDCVASWYAYCNSDWDWYLRAMISFTRPIGGGEREFDEEAYLRWHGCFCNGDSASGYHLVGPSRIRLKHYHLYLCTDGKMRYYPSEEAERLIKDEVREESERHRIAMETWFKENGYRYDEEAEYWVNDETGDVAADW